MGAFQYTPTREVDARHRAARAQAAPRESRAGEQKNVEAVLALGSSRYFTYRGILFCIPPVPFKAGQQVLSLYVRSLADAKEVTKKGTPEAMDSYYRTVSILVDVLWENCRPVKRVYRLLKWLRMMKNVFRIASEKEVMEITGFFLQGRMMSAVHFTETDQMELPIRTSSTNSKSS